VLGPLAEPAMRQSLIISDGEFSIFFTRTYAGPIMVTAILLLFLPVFKIIYDRLRKPKAQIQ
jgi:putative tricarboxylic transport membrane protein